MPLHHYLPASFIARFSVDNRTKKTRLKQISVGDKKTQNFFSSPVNKVGCINNLYTLIDDSKSSEFIDETWQEYERNLPIAIDNLINGNVDAETWTRVLIPFVACMFVRGPDFEERFKQRFPPKVQKMMEDILTPDNANFARLQDIQRLLTCVISAKWLVLTTHGKEKLITNDIGFAPFINPKFGHRGLAIPLGQKNVLVIIPSMKDNLILFENKGRWTPKIEYADIPPRNHHGLNSALAHNALRFVFGPDIKTVRKYSKGIAQNSFTPDPSQLGFPVELFSPAFEFTWHRLVGAIRKPLSDKDGWDFPLNWDVITSGWHSMPSIPMNLVEFPPLLKKDGNTIKLKFYDPEVYFDISPLPLLEQQGKYKEIIDIVTKALPNNNIPPTLRASILARRGGAFDEIGMLQEASKILKNLVI